MPYLKLRDGAELFYKTWGNPAGPVITFSHGWPLSSDNWEVQMLFFASKGYYCIAHDRRATDGPRRRGTTTTSTRSQTTCWNCLST